MKDLTGQKFNRLTVLRFSHKNGNNKYWVCRCDCGNERVVCEGNLKRGHTTSCGCYHKEKTSEVSRKYNNYNLSGDYGIGYTLNGKHFIFDKEDYEKIKDHCWYISKGYVVTKPNKTYLLHRIVMNAPENMVIDHINHNPLDNRKCNLRICTQQENNFNKSIKKNNKSGVIGVYWGKNINKWIASIRKNGKTKHLGVFADLEQAKKVRKQAEQQYFGEFAYKGV